jgi:hypothetical protein
MAPPRLALWLALWLAGQAGQVGRGVPRYASLSDRGDSGFAGGGGQLTMPGVADSSPALFPPGLAERNYPRMRILAKRPAAPVYVRFVVADRDERSDQQR